MQTYSVRSEEGRGVGRWKTDSKELPGGRERVRLGEWCLVA